MVNQSTINSILRNFGVFVVAVVVSYFLSRPVWELYNLYFGIGGGSWLDLSSIIGFIFSYIIFTPIFFGLFGTKDWSYWIGLFWIPIVLFEIYLGKYQLLFSVGLPLVSLGIGIGIYLLKQKFWDKKLV